ncbi:sulfotransferase family protein [Verrucomicrobium spinosum]|uniref:sulfotransferase family protein n=1 Tax=Verrucomicrobium spinosum TaxID=2736 RepID=UPI00155DB526|nr:sulfotransferase [Verrucomicrobium spinosum]
MRDLTTGCSISVASIAFWNDFLLMVEAVIDRAVARKMGAKVLIQVVGWAFAEQGQIVEAQVWWNHSPLGHLTYGISRPDVKAHFRGRCRIDGVGYVGQVEIRNVAEGFDSFNLKLVFTTSSSFRVELCREVTIEDGSSPPLDLGIPSSQPVGTGNAGEHLMSHVGMNEKLAPPNFFILGAGKCGTTSLYHALKQHPQIHLSAIKEPSFFTSGFQVVSNPMQYFRLFPEMEGKTRYGEASHAYFSSFETAPVLRQLFPEARFLLILRNPVHRAHSLFQHMKRHGHETLAAFELALEEEELRFADPLFRRNCPQYFWNYMYVRSSRYDLQLENYLHHFPAGQFFVLTLGEWSSDPVHWQREIFAFLGVDPSIRVSTEPQNQAAYLSVLRKETKAMLAERFSGVRERVETRIGRVMQHWDS